MLRYLKFFLIAACTAVFVDFAIVNRAFITLSLYPLPYEAKIRVFLLALVCVIAGALIGWLIMSVKLCKARAQFKAERRRAEALQNELQALKLQPPAPAAPLIAPAGGSA